MTSCALYDFGATATIDPSPISDLVGAPEKRSFENYGLHAHEWSESPAMPGTVSFAGLPDDRHHELAKRYFNGRPSSLLTFGVKGGFDAGVKFYDALRLIKRLVNIGDAKTLACHPASTTHRQMTPDEQRQAGVTPETLRMSVGIEHIDDIIADIDQALAEI